MMKAYKIKTQSFCHWCDYYRQKCRKGHVCNAYKRFAKSKKDRKEWKNHVKENF